MNTRQEIFEQAQELANAHGHPIAIMSWQPGYYTLDMTPDHVDNIHCIGIVEPKEDGR